MELIIVFCHLTKFTSSSYPQKKQKSVKPQKSEDRRRPYPNWQPGTSQRPPPVNTNHLSSTGKPWLQNGQSLTGLDAPIRCPMRPSYYQGQPLYMSYTPAGLSHLQVPPAVDTRVHSTFTRRRMTVARAHSEAPDSQSLITEEVISEETTVLSNQTAYTQPYQHHSPMMPPSGQFSYHQSGTFQPFQGQFLHSRVYNQLPPGFLELFKVLDNYKNTSHTVNPPEDGNWGKFSQYYINVIVLDNKGYVAIESVHDGSNDLLVVSLFTQYHPTLPVLLNNIRRQYRRPINYAITITPNIEQAVTLKNNIISLCNANYFIEPIQQAFEFIHPGLRFESNKQDQKSKNLFGIDDYYKCVLLLLNMFTKTGVEECLKKKSTYNTFHPFFWIRFNGIFRPLGFIFKNGYTDENIRDNFIELLNIKGLANSSISENRESSTIFLTTKQFIWNNKNYLKKEVDGLTAGIKHDDVDLLQKKQKLVDLINKNEYTKQELTEMSNHYYDIYNAYYEIARQNWLAIYGKN